MDNNQFYRGLLYELTKQAAGNVSTPAAPPAKADPPAASAPDWGTPTGRAVSSNQVPPPNSAPAPTPAPKPSGPQWYDLSTAGKVTHGVTDVAKYLSPLHYAASKGVDYAGQAITDSVVKSKGLDKIKNTGVGDALLGPKPSATEQQAAEYGMSRPDIRNSWNKELGDKTYGAAALDNKGGLTMGKDFQFKNFLNDHWGKLLLGALGLAAVSGMGGSSQQGPTINNYVSTGGQATPAPATGPKFF